MAINDVFIIWSNTVGMEAIYFPFVLMVIHTLYMALFDRFLN